MLYKAKVSFSGLVSMYKGETKELTDEEIIKDLLKAKYIEKVEDAKVIKKKTTKK